MLKQVCLQLGEDRLKLLEGGLLRHLDFCLIERPLRLVTGLERVSRGRECSIVAGGGRGGRGGKGLKKKECTRSNGEEDPRWRYRNFAADYFKITPESSPPYRSKDPCRPLHKRPIVTEAPSFVGTWHAPERGGFYRCRAAPAQETRCAADSGGEQYATLLGPSRLRFGRWTTTTIHQPGVDVVRFTSFRDITTSSRPTAFQTDFETIWMKLLHNATP